jgi:short-subunit dehydrogenase
VLFIHNALILGISNTFQVHLMARYDSELNELVKELTEGRSMEFQVSIQRIDIPDNEGFDNRVGLLFFGILHLI